MNGIEWTVKIIQDTIFKLRAGKKTGYKRRTEEAKIVRAKRDAARRKAYKASSAF
jgi:hypothetical protein